MLDVLVINPDPLTKRDASDTRLQEIINRVITLLSLKIFLGDTSAKKREERQERKVFFPPSSVLFLTLSNFEEAY